MEETIFIASDHAGFELKKQILNSIKNNLVDLGVDNKNSADYPDYAKKIVSKINSTKNSKGILICGSGIGMSIVANRHKNVRAALCHSSKSTILSRKHNNANVIALGARLTTKNVALKYIDIFIKTDFKGRRHLRRVKKI